MSNGPPLTAPSELEFLECLGVEPTVSTPADGYWQYQLTDSAGYCLELSFNTHEASIQIVLRVGGQQLFCFSNEGAEELQCSSDGEIRCLCRSHDTHTKINVATKPVITVSIAGLVDRR